MKILNKKYAQQNVRFNFQIWPSFYESRNGVSTHKKLPESTIFVRCIGNNQNFAPQKWYIAIMKRKLAPRISQSSYHVESCY